MTDADDSDGDTSVCSGTVAAGGADGGGGGGGVGMKGEKDEDGYGTDSESVVDARYSAIAVAAAGNSSGTTPNRAHKSKLSMTVTLPASPTSITRGSAVTDLFAMDSQGVVGVGVSKGRGHGHGHGQGQGQVALDCYHPGHYDCHSETVTGGISIIGDGASVSGTAGGDGGQGVPDSARAQVRNVQAAHKKHARKHGAHLPP
jgi:hypothetical protein